MRVQSLGWEEPLEKGMATHSGILPWKILWTEETVLRKSRTRLINTFIFTSQPLWRMIRKFLKKSKNRTTTSEVSESHSVMSNSLQPHGLLLSMEFFRPEYWSGDPSSRGSSQCRDWTQVSCIAGGFVTN